MSTSQSTPSVTESEYLSVHQSREEDGSKERPKLNDDNNSELPPEFVNELVSQAEAHIRRLTNSPCLQKFCRLQKVPQFDHGDFEIGEKLAHGGFSEVHEIKTFYARSSFVSGTKSLNKNRTYVKKNLKPSLAMEKVVVGVKDLATEALFLSSLRHEHILELKGWPTAGIEGFAETGSIDGFFLIYEKLESTLEDRISKQWRRQLQSYRGMDGGEIKARDLFIERIRVAIDIASAVEFLHKNRIIHRDLKPSNIGFDQDGVLKLFDFGLATELPAEVPGAYGNHDSNSKRTFPLKGNVGTPRYMAVEIIRNQPYNSKVDIYSLTVTIWEMMSLTKPFAGHSNDDVKDFVAVYGERPRIPESWPNMFTTLLERGWSENLTDRPCIHKYRETLEKIPKKCMEGNGTIQKIRSSIHFRRPNRQKVTDADAKAH